MASREGPGSHLRQGKNSLRSLQGVATMSAAGTPHTLKSESTEALLVSGESGAEGARMRSRVLTNDDVPAIANANAGLSLQESA